MNKKTIKDIPLDGKTVLVRTGFDVPLEEIDGEVKVADDYRILRGLPTIEYLLEKKCKLVLVSKLGRPKGNDPKLSMKPVAQKLAEILGKEVQFCPETEGHVADNMKKYLKPGDILVLENTRFNDGEKENDLDFAKSVARHCDYFVQDGFSIVHRKEALVDAVAHALPGVAGLLLEEEVNSINHAVSQSENPRCAIVGGAKIATKIDLLDRLIADMDMIVIGGAMANTFYVAQGINVGASVYDEDEVELARQIIEKLKAKDGLKYFIPMNDVAVATSIEQKQPRKEVDLKEVSEDELILDLGHNSTKLLLEFLKEARTVIWNGPLGLTEQPNFSYGSAAVAKYLAGAEKVYSLIGGGDTAGFIDELKLIEKVSFASTGGGASLQLISGKPLPGVEVLLDR